MLMQIFLEINKLHLHYTIVQLTCIIHEVTFRAMDKVFQKNSMNGKWVMICALWKQAIPSEKKSNPSIIDTTNYSIPVQVQRTTLRLLGQESQPLATLRVRTPGYQCFTWPHTPQARPTAWSMLRPGPGPFEEHASYFLFPLTTVNQQARWSRAIMYLEHTCNAYLEYHILNSQLSCLHT